MAKRKQTSEDKRKVEIPPGRLTITGVPEWLLDYLERVAVHHGSSLSTAAKIALAREARSASLSPGTHCGEYPMHPQFNGWLTPLGPPRTHHSEYPVHPGFVPSDNEPSRSLLLEGGGDGEPPPGGESGARPGGLAAEEIPETGTESGGRSSAEPTVFEKAADLVKIAGRLLPGDRQFVADCMSKLRTRKRSPLSGRDCGRLNALWEAHGKRDVMAPGALRAALAAEEPSARRPLRTDPPEASTSPRSGPTDEQLLADRQRVYDALRNPTSRHTTETQPAPGDGAKEDDVTRNRQALEELRREVAEGDAGGGVEAMEPGWSIPTTNTQPSEEA